MKLKWAHFIRDELFFLFSQSTMHFFLTRHFFDQCVGWLSAELVRRMEIFFGRPSFWSGASGLQASLAGERQYDVSIQNT
jgi:hypothetical protein